MSRRILLTALLTFAPVLAEIEALMRGPFTGPAPRDPAKVDWYRVTGR